MEKAMTVGDLAAVRYLIEQGADKEAKNNNGNTALNSAALNDHLDVVQYLVEQCADKEAKNNNGDTALNSAADSGHVDVVRYLVEQGADKETKNKYGSTALIRAAYNGHLDVVHYLVEQGADKETKNNNGNTALNSAASNGHLDVVRYLVEQGADKETKNNNGWTALNSAADSGHVDVVRYLVEQGADKETKNKYGSTALIRAAYNGHLDVVHYLVEQGADKETKNNNGNTALNSAASNGHLDVVRYLVEQGADKEAKNNDNWTALICAARGGRWDVVRFLVERGATVDSRDSEGWTPLMRAARRGHLDVVRFLVEHGAPVDTIDSDGWTSLMWASHGGHLDIVRFLVEHGAAVNASDSDGETPLMRAALCKQWDMVRFLVEHGAAVDATDKNGWTSMMRAAREGHLDMVQFFLEHGAAVDGSDIYGWTPLIWATRAGQLDVVRYLVEHGATVDATDNNGRTPLMWAVRFGKLELVRFLFECGSSVNTTDTEGWTPLMRAAGGGHLDVVRFLVEHGADVDANDVDGWILLMGVAENGHLDIVRFLVERGASLESRKYSGLAPLIWFIMQGDSVVVRFLVEHGAAVDASDSDGWTSLMWASHGGHLELVRFLFECGSSVNTTDTEGWTPLMRAAGGGHLDVVRFLVEHGANSNLMSMAGDTALGIAAKLGRHEIVQFLFPHVRYKDRRTEMEHAYEHVARISDIPSSWLIAAFDVEVEPFIDVGDIGGNYRGKWLDADVAVKLFVDATSASFVDEVRLWHQLRHPNILKLYGVCNSFHRFFVCEYANKGSLPEYLKSCDAERRTPWKFLYEAALGLEYLHERKTVHGNLRGSNVLIGSDGLAKLSGFGWNGALPERSVKNWGDGVYWVAPEVLNGEKVSPSSDVYSLGMYIMEAVSGKTPLNRWAVSNGNFTVHNEGSVMYHLTHQLARSTREQRDLVRSMCRTDPRKRLQMPTAVKKLEQIAEMEAAAVDEHIEPEALVAFDEFDHGKTSTLWTVVQALVAQSENNLYRQMCRELELIYDTLKTKRHPWSTLERFHSLLVECRLPLDAMSQQNRVYRLSATRARDYSVQGLHRQINQMLQLVCPREHDVEMRETEWKRLCREQIEIFVSEASEACVLLSSADLEEDRSAFVAVLRAELRNSNGKYTEKQLMILQKAYDGIVSKSLEDVQFVATPEWFIPWFELEMNEMTTLGEGGFGSVIKARWLDSEVVVKKLEIADKDATNVDKKREMRQMFEREVNIWFGLSHPHVVRLFGACHVGRPFFVCELAPNGTLVEYLRKHPDELWWKLREAALGVQYLHARGIVHGDLKGNNILIGSDGKAKVTDFGLSGVFGDDSADVILTGAWHWVAPECMLKQKPTFASDIYSLGMCIIEALRVTNGDVLYTPWGAMPNAAVKHHVTKDHRLPSRPRSCSDEAWTLIMHMCTSAPADRMIIMTVVDELEKLADRQENLSDETNHDEMQLSSSSVVNMLIEMINWIVNCNTTEDWEMNVLEKIHQLLWDRFEQVVTQLFPEGDDAVVAKTTISDLSALIEYSKQRTQAALGITDDIPLAKFTELTLGGYALHRRLDKFMAAHAVSNGSTSLHDWKSACSTFLGLSDIIHPAGCEEDSIEFDVKEDEAGFISSLEESETALVMSCTNDGYCMPFLSWLNDLFSRRKARYR